MPHFETTTQVVVLVGTDAGVPYIGMLKRIRDIPFQQVIFFQTEEIKR